MTIDVGRSELPQSTLPLDITKYNHWRDYLYNLQVAHTTIPNNENSETIGHYGFSIALDTVLELREGRQDEQGEPLIIHTDVVPDEQVMVEASQEERLNSFIQATLKNTKRRGFHSSPDRANNYSITAIAMGTAISGLEFEKVKAKLIDAITSDDLRKEDKKILSKSLENTAENQIMPLIGYLEFSQTQMTNEEQRVLVTAEKEKPDLGSKPIDLNGDVLEFVGADEGPIILSPKDEDLILPLEKSAKRSRQEMIEQARETAFQHLGLPRTEDNQGRKPPSWWINYENGEGLKSNQILVYAPHLEPTQIVKMPQMFQNMYSRGQFRPGWHLLEVTKEPPRAIIFDGKLT